jgi:hypothetical protein
VKVREDADGGDVRRQIQERQEARQPERGQRQQEARRERGGEERLALERLKRAQ